MTTFISCDQLKLNYTFSPVSNAKAVIVIVHGMGEHHGRYKNVVDFYTNNGYSVFAFDLRGHGLSEGPKGHTPSYERLMIDIEFAIKQAELVSNCKKIILYGHSLGGNLVLNYCIHKKHSLTAIIVRSPWVKLSFAPPKIRVFLAQCMNGIYPAYTEKNTLDTKAISRSKEEVNAYETDPLIHNKISAGMFFSILNKGNELYKTIEKLNCPTLLMHGDADRLTSCQATTDIAQLNTSFITLRIWNGAYHELHHEPERNEVFAFELAWLQKL